MGWRRLEPIHQKCSRHSDKEPEKSKKSFIIFLKRQGNLRGCDSKTAKLNKPIKYELIAVLHFKPVYSANSEKIYIAAINSRMEQQKKNKESAGWQLTVIEAE